MKTAGVSRDELLAADRDDQVEDLERDVAEDDQRRQRHRRRCGKTTCRYTLPLRGTVDPRRLAQLLGHAPETGEEERHDVPGERPDRRDGDGGRAPVLPEIPLVLQESEPELLEQQVEPASSDRPAPGSCSQRQTTPAAMNEIAIGKR